MLVLHSSTLDTVHSNHRRQTQRRLRSVTLPATVRPSVRGMLPGLDGQNPTLLSPGGSLSDNNRAYGPLRIGGCSDPNLTFAVLVKNTETQPEQRKLAYG
jgi:hypothetical protein